MSMALRHSLLLQWQHALPHATISSTTTTRLPLIHYYGIKPLLRVPVKEGHGRSLHNTGAAAICLTSIISRGQLQEEEEEEAEAEAEGEEDEDEEEEEGEEGEGEGGEEEEAREEWEAELLSNFDPSLYVSPDKSRKRRSSRRSHTAALASDDGLSDWVQQARKQALLRLQDRNPRVAEILKKKLEPEANAKTKKKKKKKKKKKENAESLDRVRLPKSRIESLLKESNDDEDITMEGQNRRNLGGWLYQQEIDDRLKLTPYQKEIDRFKLTPQLGRDTDEGTARERAFNRRLVGANNALDVLELVGHAQEQSRTLGVLSVLSPLNSATALHRIAKHMEIQMMPKSERLAFARKRDMAELVSTVMEVLPGCSAQGLSNIAWALSKVGGSSLYFTEMDRLAEFVLAKVSEFNPQNVANVTGAYASMQHSVPPLFATLASHASKTIGSFQPQELAQVLWAFAELMQPADQVFDALDCLCSSLSSAISEEMHDKGTEHTAVEGLLIVGRDIPTTLLHDAKLDHLANISWSYAVLNQLSRPSFRYLWQMLDYSASKTTKFDSVWHLSQVHQVNLCLKYEYPHLGLVLKTSLKDYAADAWDKHKHGVVSTSAYQKDLKWLLVSTGKSWVAEYTSADYSLDLALVEEKMALEFDGPTHFTRNTASPLGHTVLKRRLLADAGWTVLSVPYTEWEELDGEHEQMDYLKKLLKRDYTNIVYG